MRAERSRSQGSLKNSSLSYWRGQLPAPSRLSPPRYDSVPASSEVAGSPASSAPFPGLRGGSKEAARLFFLIPLPPSQAASSSALLLARLCLHSAPRGAGAKRGGAGGAALPGRDPFLPLPQQPEPEQLWFFPPLFLGAGWGWGVAGCAVGLAAPWGGGREPGAFLSAHAQPSPLAAERSRGGFLLSCQGQKR